MLPMVLEPFFSFSFLLPFVHFLHQVRPHEPVNKRHQHCTTYIVHCKTTVSQIRNTVPNYQTTLFMALKQLPAELPLVPAKLQSHLPPGQESCRTVNHTIKLQCIFYNSMAQICKTRSMQHICKTYYQF